MPTCWRQMPDVRACRVRGLGLMPLEVLNFAFVLLCLLQSCKRAKVFALACFSVLLPRVQSILSGFKFANHEEKGCRLAMIRRLRLTKYSESTFQSVNRLMFALAAIYKSLGNCRRLDSIPGQRGGTMKRLFTLALLFCSFAGAHAQKFVCGAPKPGETALNAASVFSSTSAGFDLDTKAEIEGNSCTSDSPLFFSVPAPEGSYRINVVLGGKRASATTVWAESRRLMLEKVPVKANGAAERTFDTNVRAPEIGGDPTHQVRLKPREMGALDWDH